MGSGGREAAAPRCSVVPANKRVPKTSRRGAARAARCAMRRAAFRKNCRPGRERRSQSQLPRLAPATRAWVGRKTTDRPDSGKARPASRSLDLFFEHSDLDCMLASAPQERTRWFADQRGTIGVRSRTDGNVTAPRRQRANASGSASALATAPCISYAATSQPAWSFALKKSPLW